MSAALVPRDEGCAFFGGAGKAVCGEDRRQGTIFAGRQRIVLLKGPGFAIIEEGRQEREKGGEACAH